MLVVVTGGSGSGKSAFAEDRVLSFGESRRIYIATMQAFDEESHRRIRRHRRMRSGKGFETIERYTELDELILPKNCVVLLECMSNLVANEMFREDGFHPEVFPMEFSMKENPKSIRNSWDRSTAIWMKWRMLL